MVLCLSGWRANEEIRTFQDKRQFVFLGSEPRFRWLGGQCFCLDALSESLPLSSAFNMDPRICPLLYHLGNYCPDLISHHLFPGWSQLPLTSLSALALAPASSPPVCSQHISQCDPILLNLTLTLSLVLKVLQWLPLPPRPKARRLGGLTGSASGPLPCQPALFIIFPHILVCLPQQGWLPHRVLGFAYLSPSWRSLSWPLCKLECLAQTLCPSPPLLCSVLTIWPKGRDFASFTHCPTPSV